MDVIGAEVPGKHLATEVGDPNRLLVEYSTEILIPVPGPYLIATLRRDFLKAILMLNDFLIFVDDTLRFFKTGENLSLEYRQMIITPRTGDPSDYSRVVAEAAKDQLFKKRLERSPKQTPKTVLQSRLAAPNDVFRELYDAGVLRATEKVLSPELVKVQKFDDKLKLVLEPLLVNRKPNVPDDITESVKEIAAQAFVDAETAHPALMRREFQDLAPETRKLAEQWMVAYHVSKSPQVAKPFHVDLVDVLGFNLNFFVREWAFSRHERMTIEFGEPKLIGPVGAEPVPPQGFYEREDYTASQRELVIGSRTRQRATSVEAQSFGATALRKSLEKVYYSGAGALDQLTSQASNSLLREERRNAVITLIREVSDERETTTLTTTSAATSSTITRRAVGVDDKRAATHHRMKVSVPVQVEVSMHDVGLTWAPRVFNPFFNLRQAIWNAYEQAYVDHQARYYVPEPTRPPLVFDQFIASTSILMEGEETAVENFTITLQPSDRELRPDLDNATVTWNQDESFWNDDPDHFVARLENLAFSGNRITGRVRLETDDGGADFQGSALIEVPVLRYSQETVNALAQYELDLRDYEMRREALNAQARQYATIKQREFIESHAANDDIQKTVFDALIRSICTTFMLPHQSYYKEIIALTIDWTNAKMEFETADLATLAFPDYPPDHFTNSLAVRFFLPIIKTAEDNLFDALMACGSFQVRQSVENARNRIDNERTRLENDGPDLLDEFSTEMIIGEHIEAVLSDYDMAK
jgi:hypothetical protein